MELATRYSVEDEVYDMVLKNNVQIVGFEIKHGKVGATPDQYYCCVEYYVKNDEYQGWRAEHELTRRKFEPSIVQPSVPLRAAS